MMGPYETEIAWPSKPQLDKNSRTHNHHISLRERLKELHQNRPTSQSEEQGGVHESTKAAAWAVFQHHGGGGGGAGSLAQYGGTSTGRGPSRFKIEAQMRHEVAHPSSTSSGTSGNTSWDAGSTLFDSFELDSLLKTLDQAANTASAVSVHQDVEDGDEDSNANAIVVYSQKHWLARPKLTSPPPHRPQRHSNMLQSRRGGGGASQSFDDHTRLATVDEARPLKSPMSTKVPQQRPVSFSLAKNLTLDDLFKQGQSEKEADDSDLFANFAHTPSPFNLRRNARRSFDSSLQEKVGKGTSGRDFHLRSKWKSLLHTLHLDNASRGLFNRFQGFHAQVAPHDSHKKLETKAGRSSSFANSEKSAGGGYSPKRSISSASEVTSFDPRSLYISKDVHPPAVNVDDHDHPQRSPSSQFWKAGLKAALSRPFSRPGSFVSEKPEYSGSGSSPRRMMSFMGSPKSPHNQRVTKKKTEHLQSAWASLTTKLQRHHHHQEPGGVTTQDASTPRRRPQSMVEITVPLSHHEHHHHHHHHHHDVPPEAADYELTVQAISRRVSRSSFEEKLALKFAVEDDDSAQGGMKTPRNSLATPRTSGDVIPSSHDYHHQRSSSRTLTPWEAESSSLVPNSHAHVH